MVRRIVIALTFVAALGAAGVGLASNAAAHGGCGYGNYYSNYGGGYATYNGYRGVYYGGYPTYGPSYFATGYTLFRRSCFTRMPGVTITTTIITTVMGSRLQSDSDA